MFVKTTLGPVLLCICFVLASCGGGGGNSGGGSGGGGSTDTTAPSGYGVSFVTDPIDATNEASVSFSVSGAEIGTTYEYSLTSGSSALEGDGSVSAASFDIEGLDLSAFPAGTVELDLRLTDSSGNEGSAANDSVQKTSEPTVVTLSGTVTFDFVPHRDVSLGEFGLDYSAIEARPVRGATVQVLNASEEEISRTQTDEFGNYAVNLDPDQDVQVRVRAELVQSDVASWDFSVTDNTQGNALYVVDGSLSSLGASSQTRDLHAPSGWGFPGYTSERAAAPFAILDTLYQIVEKFVEVDSTIQFPAMEFRWSENNVPEDGDLSIGQISTSSYRSGGASGNVYILGAVDVDTDEYDQHVIVHEWGHYFEDQLSRSDSIGGSHFFEDHLDMRVAFGEGWGNALSGMILDDPLYIDTGGEGQEQSGGIDLELNDGLAFPSFDPTIGWYSEFSVQSILYDLYDASDDGADDVSVGLGPIYDVLTTDEYREQGTVTAIYSFIAQFREDNPGEQASIDALAVAQNINGTGYDGLGETNDGGVSLALPVYYSAEIGGDAVEVCSVNSEGEFNRLGNRQFVQVTLPTDGVYGFSVERVSGNLDANPELTFIGPFPPLGEQVLRFNCGESDTGDTETINCGGLLAGDHVLEVFDAENTDDDDDTGGETCFDVTVTDLN